jgi:hypothetical protein
MAWGLQAHDARRRIVTGLFAAFFFETGLITYRAVTQGQVVTRKGKQSTAPLPAPLPSLYTSAIIIYGVLGLAPQSLAPLPALVGWGFVVATFLNLYTPGSANAGAASNTAAAQALTTSPTTPKK